MKNRRILTSAALSGLLLTCASGFDLQIPDLVSSKNKTGVWFKYGTGSDYRNAFSTDYNNGGFDGFPIYKEKEGGFALGDKYPVLNSLEVMLRNRPDEAFMDDNRPTGDDGGVGRKEYFAYRIDNTIKKGWLSFGTFQVDGSHGLSRQDPIFYVASGQNLTIGDPNKWSDGITINYARITENNDWVTGQKTADTIAKFEIKGDLRANIKTTHATGSASNTTDGGGVDEDGNPNVPLVVWGNVTGSISSTMTFDTKTAEISMPEYQKEYTEVVDHYSINYKAKKELMNRWVITGNFTSDEKNPLRFISKDYSSTYLEFGGAYKGGKGLAIGSYGSTMPDGKKRRTLTLVKAKNNVEIGEVYALDKGSIYMDLDKGAKIHTLGFGANYDGKTFDPGYGIQGGLIYMNVKSGTLSIENDLATDGKENFYKGRNVALFDTSGIQGNVIFDIKAEMKFANWVFSVGKDTKIKLGGQYNYIDQLTEKGGVSTLHAAKNVHISINRDQTKQSLIWIGDRETDKNTNLDSLSGLNADVVKGGLTIETNINKFKDGYDPDLVVIRNMLINRTPDSGTITLIPRTKAEQDFTQHVGKTVGYTTSGKYGTVDFTKTTTWKPNDGILKGHFEIELESKTMASDSNYKQWTIKKYEYIGDEIKPPVKPDPEPPIDPKPPIDPDPDPKPPVDPDPKPPVDPDPDPKPPVDPDPKPPVDPDKPVDPDPLPPEGGDNGGTKPPVTPPEGGEGEKPDPKPPVNNTPFTETFVRDMTKSTGTMKNLYLATFNSMNKRLGELRDSHNVHGVWGRVFAGSYNGDVFWSLQAGYDNLVKALPNLNVYVGAAASYAGDDFTNLGEFVFYSTAIQDNGWYNDSLFKVSIMNSKTPLSKLMHYGITVSDEVGYRVRIGQFFIDPQIELSLGYLTGGKFDTLYNNSRVNVNFSDTIHFRARYGVAGGYDYIHKDKVKIQAYLGLFGETDKFTKATGTGSTLGAYGMRQEFAGAYTDDTRMVLNVGTNVDLKEAGKLYLDFEKSFLGDFNIDWKVNLGFRYSFGDKVKLQPRSVVEDKIEENKGKEDVTPVKLKDEKGDNVASKSKGTKKASDTKISKK